MSVSPLRQFLANHNLSSWSDMKAINAFRSESDAWTSSQFSFFCYAINEDCSAKQLRQFIELGANVNPQFRTSCWKIPLYVAVYRSNFKNVRILCEAGADIYATWPIDERRSGSVIDCVWGYAVTPRYPYEYSKAVKILEYMLVTHNIPMHTRGWGAATVPQELHKLLGKITARITSCQRTCHLTLLWFRFCMKHWVAKQVAERIARMVWASRRQELWDLK